jgi:hypothetical protein
MRPGERLRLLPVPLALIAVALGLWAALDLIGWSLALPLPGFEEMHGPIMVNGVLATLIGLERAVAVHRRWALVVPMLSGAGALLLLAPRGEFLSGAVWIASGAGLTGLFLMIYRWQPALHSGVMLAGAVLLLMGNVAWWVSGQVPWMVLWWVGFLVLLVAAERLELARVLASSRFRQATFTLSVGLIILAPVLSLWDFAWGVSSAVAGLAGLGLWLLRFDIARLNVRQSGGTRFVALCLLSGYVWLLEAAVIAIWGGLTLPYLVYDAFLHSIFLGFVFSMIMAHSMVILRVILRREVRFRKTFYLPFVLIESTLAVRVYADLEGLPVLRMWAGLFNVVAIAWFGLEIAVSLLRDSLGWVRSILKMDFMDVQ